MEIQWVRPVEFREIDRRRVEARVAELAREDSDMIDVRVTALPNSHHRHGGHEVRIACEASGHQIVATRTSADAGLALNEALAVFEREVRRMRHRRTEQRDRAASIRPRRPSTASSTRCSGRRATASS